MVPKTSGQKLAPHQTHDKDDGRSCKCWPFPSGPVGGASAPNHRAPKVQKKQRERKKNKHKEEEKASLRGGALMEAKIWYL